MKQWWMLSVLPVVLGFSVASALGADQGKIRVLLTYGGHGFEAKPFFAMFDAMPEVRYTKAELPKEASRLKPGLQKQFDVLVMYDMVSGFKPEEQKAFVALLNQGIGVVSLHHNLGAHRDWDEFRKIIGGKFIFKECEIDGKKYRKSGWAHDQKLRIMVADRSHPITQGLADFLIHDETYSGYYVAPNVKVLLKTDHPDNNPEVAWVTQYGNSRVCYLMLGHDAHAYNDPNYRNLVRQAIRWAAGR